jgi:hypothetical protein
MKNYIDATGEFFGQLIPLLMAVCVLWGVTFFTRRLHPKLQYLIQTPLIIGVFAWFAWRLEAFYVLWFPVLWAIIDGLKLFYAKQKQ